MARVIATELTGVTPATLRLAWRIDQNAHAGLEEEIFGKRILVTDHNSWPLEQVIDAYRSQEYLEAAFRQAKDLHAVSFAPIRHFTDHKIRVHLFTCVLALAIAHLMRREATRAGLPMSVPALLAELEGIGEHLSCSTRANAAAPGPATRSPGSPPPSSASTGCSTSPGTPRTADVGNTPN